QTHVPTPARGRALPSTAGPARVVTPGASRGAPDGGLPLGMLAATLGLALLLGCADALRRLVRRRAPGLPKAVRIIDSDALLPDDTDLLRERDASHRARVHDDCRGRAGSSHQQRRDETFFLTGTDEHASKVYRVAEEQGL